MFRQAYVRKIVDESLDRMLPISRQPPEKINALVEQCQQLYPEFIHEARNRIRSYLKSCRRNKKIRELEHVRVSFPWRNSFETPGDGEFHEFFTPDPD